MSHLGPPTAARRTASAARQPASVSSVRAVPCASMLAPPKTYSVNSTWEPRSSPSTRTAGAAISGPMPSPGRTAMVVIGKEPYCRRGFARRATGRRGATDRPSARRRGATDRPSAAADAEQPTGLRRPTRSNRQAFRFGDGSTRSNRQAFGDGSTRSNRQAFVPARLLARAGTKTGDMGRAPGGALSGPKSPGSERMWDIHAFGSPGARRDAGGTLGRLCVLGHGPYATFVTQGSPRARC